jgi:hypothetical protein
MADAAIDFATDFVGDFAFDALPVDSFVTDFGGEFLTDFSGDFVDFGSFVDFNDLTYQVGDFAGSADWFDFNYGGDILSDSFTDFGVDPFGGFDDFAGISNFDAFDVTDFSGYGGFADVGEIPFSGISISDVGEIPGITAFSGDVASVVQGPGFLDSILAGEYGQAFDIAKEGIGGVIDKATDLFPSQDQFAKIVENQAKSIITGVVKNTIATGVSATVGKIPVVGGAVSGAVTRGLTTEAVRNINGYPTRDPSLSQILGIPAPRSPLQTPGFGDGIQIAAGPGFDFSGLLNNATNPYKSTGPDALTRLLGDPNAPEYTGDDPIVRERLGLPPVSSSSPLAVGFTDDYLSSGDADSLLEAQARENRDFVNDTGGYTVDPFGGIDPIPQTISVVANYESRFDEFTGRYEVVETNTGVVVASGLDEDESQTFAADQNAVAENIDVPNPDAPLVELSNPQQAVDVNAIYEYPRGPNGELPFDDEGNLMPGFQLNENNEPVFVGFGDPTFSPANVPFADRQVYISRDDQGFLLPGWAFDENLGDYFIGEVNGRLFVDPNTALSAEMSRKEALLTQARQQFTIQNQRKQANDGDWRVKLRLAPGANYLYRANDGKGSQAGILQPLAVTDGVIFPYTPVINTVYKANYNSYDLTHSNYRGYFYQNSYVGEINIQAVFTAQDTAEANYLLAVIHFFRSVTKMFYGQDAQRGAPPPLVFLQGLGTYQFNLHPCVVSQFNYNLPADVDYIRAGSPNIDGTNLLIRRDRQNLPTNVFSGALERLRNAGLPKGGIFQPIPSQTLGLNSPTYVPTKLQIDLILLPIQSRRQVSQQFSLQNFANGNLIKGGTNQPGAFW